MTPFSAIFVPEELREAVSDRAWLQGMLDAERALATGGRRGRPRPGGRRRSDRRGVPRRALRPGASRRRRPRGREPGGAARPRALRDAVGDEAADYVHLGATSQDIVDTAAMLVSRRAVALVLARARPARRTAARSSRATHRSTPMAARTLLQQAVPTTFGLKAAGWLVSVLEARGDSRPCATSGSRRSSAAPPEPSPRSGTRDSRSSALYARGARARGARAPLAHEPPAPRGARRGTGRSRGRGREGRPRHRAPRAERGGRGRRGVGRTAPRRCRRSAIPSAPRSRWRVRAWRTRTPESCSASLAHEHERAVGGWHAEWEALSGALAFAGGAAAAAADAVTGLEVDAERMRANLDASGGLVVAERVSFALTPRLGRSRGARGRRRGRARGVVPRRASRRRADRALRRRARRAARPDRLPRSGRGARRPRARRVREDTADDASPTASTGPSGAPVLVLSNSLGTTQELWERQLPALAERFRVLTYDHPATARPRSPSAPCTVERLAHGCSRSSTSSGLERVSLCGVSLGGMVGMALALSAPERVERLVLTCTSAYLGPPEGWTERARIVRTDGMEAIADTVVGAGSRLTLERRSRRPWRASARCSRRRRRRATRAAARPSAPGTRGSGSPRSPRPCSSIAGADDPATPVEHAELIASRIPGARLEVLERRPISRTSSGRTPSPRPCSSISDRRWRHERRRYEDETRGARGRARGPGDRRHDRIHGRLPGSHHALRLGRDLVATRPRSPHAELHHDHGARRDRPRARARDARARRAAQRGHPGRDQGGSAPVRRLLRGARGQRRIRDRPTRAGGERRTGELAPARRWASSAPVRPDSRSATSSSARASTP